MYAGIPIVALIVLVVLSSLAVWAVNRLVTDAMLKNIFIVVIVVIVVMSLLRIFGLM